MTHQRLIPGSVTPKIGWRKQDWAYEQLREWILSGHLQPGSLLDQEYLAEMLGISRIPLREALARLVAQGWVSGEAHRRLTVSELSLEDARDIYSARKVLEGLLAEKAAARALPDDLIGTRAILERQQVVLAEGDRAEIQKLDREFHLSIYQIARMPQTLSATMNLYNMAERYVRLYLSKRSHMQASFAEHMAIYSAVESRDSALAGALSLEHVTGGLGVLEENVITLSEA